MVCGLCMLVAVPLGTLLAIGLRRSDVPGRRWAWIAISSQLAVPLYVIAGSWSAGLGLQGWLRFRSSSLDWLSVDRLSGGWKPASVRCWPFRQYTPWLQFLGRADCFTRPHQLIVGKEEAALIDGGNWHLCALWCAP
ncbi:MAG: hypothetical protein R3C56_31850 [Pirellulaceae bacterium]